MGRKMNLTGKRFGKLLVKDLAYIGKGNKKFWYLHCDCGGYSISSASDLNTGKVKSCGCLRKTNIIKRNTTHGQSKTRLYRIWRGMISRCYNRNATDYKNYGLKGIKVLDTWKSDFMHFYKWSYENGYKEDLTIDRLRSNEWYSPNNCRWIPKSQQGENRRKRISYPERDLKGRFTKCEV